MAKARRRADRTQTPAVHRGKHTDGKKGGVNKWVHAKLFIVKRLFQLAASTNIFIFVGPFGSGQRREVLSIGPFALCCPGWRTCPAFAQRLIQRPASSHARRACPTIQHIRDALYSTHSINNYYKVVNIIKICWYQIPIRISLSDICFTT